MDNQDVNSIDELSNESNTLPDDLYENPNDGLEENQQPAPQGHIADSSPENTSLEEADKLDEGVPEIVKEVVPHKEDPSQFEYWQSQSDTKDGTISAKDAEINALREQVTQREIVKEQLTPEPLVAPVKPATQFVDDVETWAKYYEDKDAYRDKVSAERQGEFNTFKQESADEKQLRLQAEQGAQQKAYTLGEFQKRGMDREKASRALDYFSKQRESPDSYYDDLSAFFDWKETQTPNNRADQIQKRVNRQGEVQPLGLQTSKTETEKTPEEEAFFEEMKFNQGHGTY